MFCCNVHRGVVGGTEAGVAVTNSWLRNADLPVDVAARDGTINLLPTSETASFRSAAHLMRGVLARSLMILLSPMH
jgi:hypothetical protein